jgi:hypothetical protein
MHSLLTGLHSSCWGVCTAGCQAYAAAAEAYVWLVARITQQLLRMCTADCQDYTQLWAQVHRLKYSWLPCLHTCLHSRLPGLHSCCWGLCTAGCQAYTAAVKGHAELVASLHSSCWGSCMASSLPEAASIPWLVLTTNSTLRLLVPPSLYFLQALKWLP